MVAVTLVPTWQRYQGHSPLNHTLVLGIHSLTRPKGTFAHAVIPKIVATKQ